MTEKEKMLNEELYRPEDKELTDLRMKAQLLYREYNQTSIKEEEKREQLLHQLFGSIGKKLEIVPPFYCDYGCNISIGDEVFMNMNCCILDIAPITIGNQVMFGPNVQVYGATHPLNPTKRYLGEEAGKRIIIEDQVWIGGGAILCPGVKIGKGAVVAAGAIVVKDVPANTFVGGNPARIIKTDLHLMT